MSKPEIRYIKGTFPILFSAPHCRIHYRSNLTGMHRDAEEFTDQIASEIASGYKTHGVYLVKEVQYDPNSDSIEENPYKQRLVEIGTPKKKLKALVDIHGLNETKNYDIGIYFSRRFLNSKKLAIKIADFLSIGPLKEITPIFFNHSVSSEGRETIAHLAASNLKIPAVQIEVARYIREDPTLRSTLINNLGRFASTL